MRSSPTQRGHVSMIEPQAREPDAPVPLLKPVRPAPWTEQVYVSPSGRIFLPAGFDFEAGRPRALTPQLVRRRPPAPRPAPHRAHVVLGHVAPRPRTITRESWVVPEHLAQA